MNTLEKRNLGLLPLGFQSMIERLSSDFRNISYPVLYTMWRGNYFQRLGHAFTRWVVPSGAWALRVSAYMQVRSVDRLLGEAGYAVSLSGISEEWVVTFLAAALPKVGIEVREDASLVVWDLGAEAITGAATHCVALADIWQYLARRQALRVLSEEEEVHFLALLQSHPINIQLALSSLVGCVLSKRLASYLFFIWQVEKDAAVRSLLRPLLWRSVSKHWLSIFELEAPLCSFSPRNISYFDWRTLLRVYAQLDIDPIPLALYLVEQHRCGLDYLFHSSVSIEEQLRPWQDLNFFGGCEEAHLAEAVLNHFVEERSLSLALQDLEQVPAAITELHHIEQLFLGNNQLQRARADLVSLNQLQVLDLSNNALRELPDTWAAFQLVQLRLTHNRFAQWPRCILEMSSLESLDMSYNALQEIPSTFSWSNLQVLRLAHNPISRAVYRLAELHNLRVLNVAYSRIVVWDFLAGLPQLQYLSLAGNRLKAVPDSLAKLTTLEHIDLSHNQLSEWPTLLNHCPWLVYIDVSNNPITVLSKSLDYFRCLRRLSLPFGIHIEDFARQGLAALIWGGTLRQIDFGEHLTLDCGEVFHGLRHLDDVQYTLNRFLYEHFL